MVKERIQNLEGRVEVGGGGNGRERDKVKETAQVKGRQRKEYILFITDASEEIEEAANYVNEKLSAMRQPKSGLELVVEKVPDFDSAVKFWKDFVFETPLVVADKRTRESTGVRFKIIQSDADHETFTGVVDAYTVRTIDGKAYKVRNIDPELLAQTILNLEMKEMLRYRKALEGWTEGKKEAQRQERRARIDEAVQALAKNLGISPELAAPDVRVSAVVRALREYYGRNDPEALRMVALAGQQLDYLFKEIPPGILYITHSAKEGVLGLRTTLEGLDDKVPLFAIKRFKELGHAKFVHSLSEWLLERRKAFQAENRITYLNTPRTYWPSLADGYGFVFMDAVVGEDLIKLMPKINAVIKGGSYDYDFGVQEEAGALKDFLFLSSLDNIAYWQFVSPQAAQSVGYVPQPEHIREFVYNALIRSAEVLEQVTNQALDKQERQGLEAAAKAAAEAITLRYAIGLDSGPRNILVRERTYGRSIEELIAYLKNPQIREDNSSANEQTRSWAGTALTQGAVREQIFQVDIPYEFRTVHQLRDFVRLVYAPTNELSKEEVDRLFAYFLLKGQFLRATTQQERVGIGEEISAVVDRARDPQRLNIVTSYRANGPHDLDISVMAEAARMHAVVPPVFLSKAYQQLNGKLKSSMTEAELSDKLTELTDYNRAWAQAGLDAARRVAGEAGEPLRQQINGAIPLFEKWGKAHIAYERLPDFTPFANV